MIGIVMGVPTLRELFEEKYYTDLEGGILELRAVVQKCAEVVCVSLPRFGDRLVDHSDRTSVAPNLRHLYAYMLENLYIQGILDFNEACLPIFSRDVLAKIRQGDGSWESMVPPQVATLIKDRKLRLQRLSMNAGLDAGSSRSRQRAASPGFFQNGALGTAPYPGYLFLFLRSPLAAADAKFQRPATSSRD